MQRFYSAQDGHYVPLIAPKDITGGASSPAFAMKLYSHASILIAIGASAAAPGAITLSACTDASGSNPTPISFNLYPCETASGDVLGAKIAVPTTGYVPPATDNIFYVIEVGAAHLGQGFPYLKLNIANGSNSIIASAFAILSGARYASDQSPTVLA